MTEVRKGGIESVELARRWAKQRADLQSEREKLNNLKLRCEWLAGETRKDEVELRDLVGVNVPTCILPVDGGYVLVTHGQGDAVVKFVADAQ